MATRAPVPKFEPADVVYYNDKGQYIVLGVETNLGFNRYHIMSLENGGKEIASRHELTKVHSNIVNSTMHEYGNKKEKENEILAILPVASTSTATSDDQENIENMQIVPATTTPNTIIPATSEPTLNFPPMSGIGSLFSGANIASGANITINFNAGNYTQSNQK